MDREAAWQEALQHSGLLGLVKGRLFAKLQGKTSLDDEELSQELESYAWEGMLKAVETYDPTKGRFSTYASVVVHRMMLDGLRYLLRLKGLTRTNKVWIDSLERLAQAYTDVGEETDMLIPEDIVEPDFSEEADAHVDATALVEKVRRVLDEEVDEPNRTRFIRYLAGETATMIAEDEGKNESSVRRSIRVVQEHVAKRLREEGVEP